MLAVRAVLHEPPRRVLAPLPFSPISVSDYLFPGEGPVDSLASLADLLDLGTLLEGDVQVRPYVHNGSKYRSLSLSPVHFFFPFLAFACPSLTLFALVDQRPATIPNCTQLS